MKYWVQICLGIFIVLKVDFLHAQAEVGEKANLSAELKVEQTDVPVRLVTLFSSGVGYFEHSGKVIGDSSTELHFKTQQINDILKSLVLEDLDGGHVSSIVYPSQDPIEKTLRSFQVDITTNPSLGELLNQLRGAKVKVSVQAEIVPGTILGLEIKKKTIGDRADIIEMWYLNLISDGNIRSVSLDDVQKIELEDVQLQQELNKALLALSQARDQDKKPVVIHFQGQGERRVRLGYVVETPVWKTSYRLLMPKEVKDKGKLQGWAIIENQMDNDWNNVELSLVSGRPISFVQDIYQPLYIPRPVVQQELFASLRPQTYDDGLALDQEESIQSFGIMDKKAMPAAAAPAMESARGRGREQYAYQAEAQSPMDAFSSISGAVSAQKMGELFQYTVGNVSLPRQRSAMIPIVADDIEVERVSIYNQNVFPKNPLNGARIKNTSGKHLLQGPITVFDDNTYAGDAQIDNLPPNQERLISYAIDLEVYVDPDMAREVSALETGKIVKGILELTRKNTVSQSYLIENKSKKDKTIIVEHHFRPGWKLIDSPTPIETTDRLYRFKDSVKAGEQSKLVIKEEFVQGEVLAILSVDLGQLEYYSRAGEIPKNVRETLIKLMELRSAMLDTERKIQDKEKELRDISQEQERIRSNMETVDKSSQYYTRLLQKLNDQETKIENLQKEIDELKQAYEKQRQDLENSILNTNIG